MTALWDARKPRLTGETRAAAPRPRGSSPRWPGVPPLRTVHFPASEQVADTARERIAELWITTIEEIFWEILCNTEEFATTGPRSKTNQFLSPGTTVR